MGNNQRQQYVLATSIPMEKPLKVRVRRCLVEKNGIIHYIQVVPELSHLPDMETAFNKAIELLSVK